MPLPVAPGRDVVEVEAGLVGVGLAELRRDQHVLARLVPEVVVQRRRAAAVLPAALDLERLRVEDGEAAGAVAVGVAEHADHDVVAGHAVDGVRARVAGLLARAPSGSITFSIRGRRGSSATLRTWIRDERKPGHDQVRAVGPVARRAAAVPAEVMQLVADVRHRRLVDDPARPRRRPRRGSRARRPRCPRAGRRGRGTPPAAPAAPRPERRGTIAACRDGAPRELLSAILAWRGACTAGRATIAQPAYAPVHARLTPG